jgi:diguanylate cyclase
MGTKGKEAVDWTVRANRTGRNWSAVLLFPAIGAHMVDQGGGPLLWTLLVLHCLAYPQLVYWRAAHARDQRRAEMTNLVLDALLFGMWAAALQFPLWITYALILTATIDLTTYRSWSGLFKAIGAFLAGVLLVVAVNGLKFSPATGWPSTILSMLANSVYVLVVVNFGYHRALKLSEARKKLREREEVLEQQLEEIQTLQSKLRDQATRDPLTGLYNRRYFDATFERESARCQRDAIPMSLVILDIDHFKHINDTYGHAVGDEVLRTLAGLLQAEVRESDIACRIGGEEFLLLLPGAGEQIAFERARQLCLAFSAMSTSTDEGLIKASLSAGVATCPESCALSEDLLKSADAALYQAKKAGRNRALKFRLQQSNVPAG